MSKPRLVGPVVACTLMELFLRKQWELTEEELDELFDVVIALMEDARDERWRCKPKDA